MSDRLTIAMNTMNKAPSQYTNMPFDSVVEFNGKLVMFGDTGIFEEGGTTDAGTAISWWLDTPTHDFESREQKTIEAYDIGYEPVGNVTVTLTGDEDTTHARAYTLAPTKTGQVQQDMFKTLKKYLYGKARYWKVRVAGTGNFSLDFLALAPVFLKRKAR